MRDGLWQPGDNAGPDPAFFRISDRPAVHVQGGWWTPEVFRGLGIGAMITQRPVARCGAYQHGYVFNPDVYVGTFDDIELCQRCHRTVPEEHRAVLFEHPQHHPDDDIEDPE